VIKAPLPVHDKRASPAYGQGSAGGLLLALAPWPVLLKVVGQYPGPWTLWGTVPDAVRRHLEFLEVEVLADDLPNPLHHHTLPDSVRRSWAQVIVPALSHPLPSRWPVIRRLMQLDSPIFVTSGDGLTPVEPHMVPLQDPFTWAIDRLSEPPAQPEPGAQDVACITADMLGDVLLTLPAIGTFAAARTHVTMVVRDEYTNWVTTILNDAPISVTGIGMVPWRKPQLSPSRVAVDLTPPDQSSPLTPALVRETPAADRRRCTSRLPFQGLSEMVGDVLHVAPAWPSVRRRSGGIGLIAASGSSAERDLSPSAWRALTTEAAKRTGVSRWVVVGTPAGHRADALASALPSAVVAPFPLTPAAVLEICDSAALAVGVSTALTHLTALRGIPTVVLEHPETAVGVFRLPFPHVRYIRSEQPWWQPEPSPEDIARALAPQPDSYGFAPDEWSNAISDMGDWLARL